MSQLLVTVVVPVYNVEQYLDRCVDSIVNQTYSNLEIILVDDGSTDSCPVKCDLWMERDERIKVIHKKNAGLGMARNTGIENASGQYIFFFDSDDYVDKTIVEKCVNSAEAHNADAVIFGRCDVYPDGKEKRLPIKANQHLFCREECTGTLLPMLFTYEIGVGVSACGKMFSLRSIMKHNLRFKSEREIISEDAYFALEFFSAATVVTVVPESLYYYYKRGNSLSRVFRKDRQEKNDQFIKMSLEYVKQVGLSDKLAKHLMVRYHSYTIAAMKQLMTSKLTDKEKRKELWEIFRSSTLQKTLAWDVLKLENITQKVFFILLKLKCFWLCLYMLRLKIKGAS